MKRLKYQDRIGSDWVVVQPLGEGGMAAVYLAQSLRLPSIRAAVKVPRTDPEDADGMARFEREVEALGRLRHPHIVGLRGFGVDEAQGLVWLAMDFIRGADLAARLRSGPLRPAEAQGWFSGLFDGLSHAHDRGVFHRDIKPSNILVAPTGPVLIDWGVVLHGDRERLTKTGHFPGTIPYFPPEVFLSGAGRVDARKGDLYALGVVLYEALTADEAFPSDPELTPEQNSVRIAQKKARAGALDPGDGAGRALRRLVQGLTHPDPDQRLADPEIIRGLLDPSTANIGLPKTEPTKRSRRSGTPDPKVASVVIEPRPPETSPRRTPPPQRSPAPAPIPEAPVPVASAAEGLAGMLAIVMLLAAIATLTWQLGFEGAEEAGVPGILDPYLGKPIE